MTLVAAPVIAALTCSSSLMPTPADSQARSTCGRRVTRHTHVRRGGEGGVGGVVEWGWVVGPGWDRKLYDSSSGIKALDSCSAGDLILG